MKPLEGPYIYHADKDRDKHYNRYSDYITGDGGVVICRLQRMQEVEENGKWIEMALNCHKELIQFCQEVALTKYKDSDVESLLETLRVRANYIIAKI